MRKIVSLLFVALLTNLAAWSQTRSVTGKVTEQTGDPVPFATVNVKGTRSTVAAGADGVFKIQAKTGDVLVVTAVNFQPTEITVGSESNVSVTLTRGQNTLTDVVVTTSFGIQRQAKSLGYSTTKVTGKEALSAKPISLANGLTGRAAGLQINTVNNGLFAPTRIVLRGNRSLLGNNQPLIIVDGAIFYNDLSTLNPEDIVDYNILKGSSASALYGSDASNGVIVITTKRGSVGKPSITFTSTTQFETLSYLPKLQNRFGSNGGEAFVNDFNDLSTYIPYENQSYGPEYNGKPVPVGRPVSDGSVLVVPYSATNNKLKFFDVGLTTQNSVSYQAGDANSKFFISAQDVNSKAIMPGDKGRREAFRVSGAKTYGKFSANYTFAYTYKTTDVTNTGAVYQLVMNTPAHIPLTSLSDWQNNKFADVNGFYNDYFDNPYWQIDNNRNKNIENNLVANINLSLQATKWLNLSYRLAMTNNNNEFNGQYGDKSYSSYAKSDTRVIYSNPDGTGFDTVNESPKYIAKDAQASFFQSRNTNFQWTSDFLANVDQNIGKDFNIKLVTGVSYQDNKLTGNSLGAGALFFPIYNVSIRTGDPSVNNYFAQARKFGILGDLTVGFRNYAFLHGAFRTDIDSRLSQDNKYIPYYSVDASLVLSDIFPSIVDNNVLSFAKIRGAHSLTGNASPLAGGSQYIANGAYVINPISLVANGFPFNGLAGYVESTVIANPNLKPEQSTEDEVGLELGFWKNRINFNISAYHSKLSDGIVTARISNASGASATQVNAANVDNKGVEAELKFTVIKSKSVTWNVNANYTFQESKVTSINGDQKALQINPFGNPNAYAIVDQAYPVIQAYDWKRDPSGRVIVDPVTGNPSQDPTLRAYGQATPKHIIGINSSVSWKGFTLSAVADYRGGHKIVNILGRYMDFTGIAATTAITGRQRFVFPNSSYLQDGKYVANTNVTVDDANFNFWPGLYRSVSGNYVTSAAAWKLREVSITYDFPANWFGFTKIIQKASLTVSGRNLLLLKPDSNVWTDPEFNETTGNDVGRTSENQAPPSRIFGATLTVQF